MAESDEDKAAAIRARVTRAHDFMVLPRMRLHGFWPKDQGVPADPVDEARERYALEEQQRKLIEQITLSPKALQDALDKERARRIEESRKKRKERAAARAAEAKARREAWAKERARTIVHAGEGVSATLSDEKSDEAKLLALGLPVMHNAGDLARALDVDLRRLRFLTFHRRSARVVHYRRFTLPKKTGGLRHISAPRPAMKKAQRFVFDAILAHAASPARLHADAHGFITSRNVVSNAVPHVGKHTVVNLDLKDFFPSITFPRVRGLFRHLGYSGSVATLLALLCTECPRAQVDVSNINANDAPKQRLHVALEERQLPQGACTSPAITNLLCRRLDARLHGVAHKLGYAYTRYADDLTFSGSGRDVSTLLYRVRRIVTDEGLRENNDKTRVMRKGRRQEVTGVVVNTRPAVARDDVRKLRAILHQAKKTGLAAQRRPDTNGALPSETEWKLIVRGRIAWVQMVDREKGDRLKAAFDAIV